MYPQLLCAAAFCLLFSSAWSIQCYLGTDDQCMLPPDMNDCEPGETCVCIKYRYRCSNGNQGCTKNEILAGHTQWGYAKVNVKMCGMAYQLLSIYLDATCCSDDQCNRPINGKCLWFQFRR